MKISVILPARNEHPQATFTLQSIWDELEDTDLDWETILVDNLSDDKTSSFAEKRCWGQRGRHKVIRYTEQGSCWGARSEGVRAATGDIIFLFDAHVLLSRDLIQKTLRAFEEHPEAWVIYNPVVWMGDTHRTRGYGYSLGENNGHMLTKFWGSWTRKKVSDEPYRIPMSGTAAIACRGEYLRKIGAWPAEMSVYGGGEQWISLLCWMLGGECWLHPDTYVYHLADTRGYSGSADNRKYSTNDAHFFNKSLVAYALGGEKWWLIVLNRCLEVWHKPYHEAAVNIAHAARVAGEKYRKWVNENAQFTLDEVLEAQPWTLVPQATT